MAPVCSPASTSTSIKCCIHVSSALPSSATYILMFTTPSPSAYMEGNLKNLPKENASGNSSENKRTASKANPLFLPSPSPSPSLIDANYFSPHNTPRYLGEAMSGSPGPLPVYNPVSPRWGVCLPTDVLEASPWSEGSVSTDTTREGFSTVCGDEYSAQVTKRGVSGRHESRS